MTNMIIFLIVAVKMMCLPVKMIDNHGSSICRWDTTPIEDLNSPQGHYPLVIKHGNEQSHMSRRCANQEHNSRGFPSARFDCHVRYCRCLDFSGGKSTSPGESNLGGFKKWCLVVEETSCSEMIKASILQYAWLCNIIYIYIYTYVVWLQFYY